jgi:hypothetical protein
MYSKDCVNDLKNKSLSPKAIVIELLSKLLLPGYCQYPKKLGYIKRNG